MRTVLVCDQKWRDLPSLVAIQRHLRRLGHWVFIVSTKQFEALLPVIQPDAVVLNNFWETRYHRLARRLRDSGIAVVVLPTEGATPTQTWGPMVFGAFSDYSLIDYQMCWNRTTADGIVEYGSMPREKLDVVGCPRFDFAVPPLVETCMSRDQLCQYLGLDPGRPVVSWASRYALAKMAYASPERRAVFDRRVEEIGYRQTLEMRGYTINELIDNYKTSLDAFLDAFATAARAKPDLQFVFKPHPNDDVGYISEHLGRHALSNVTQATGIYIGDVLRGSDVLVNADCSTSVEAWIHGIPVVDAQLHVDHIAGRPDIASGNFVARSEDEVVSLIDDCLDAPTIPEDLAVNRDQFIEKWFDKVDGHRCTTAAQSLDSFMSAWGRRKKFYPVSHGGGVRSVVKASLHWAAGVPSGYTIAQAIVTRSADRIKKGQFDKVISRLDVSAQNRVLKPHIAV